MGWILPFCQIWALEFVGFLGSMAEFSKRPIFEEVTSTNLRLHYLLAEIHAFGATIATCILTICITFVHPHDILAEMHA